MDNTLFPTTTGALGFYQLKLNPWTPNKLVACTPFPKQSVEKVMKGGIAMIDKKVSLQELTVVFPSEDSRYQPGMRVFIRGDQVVQQWAREAFTTEDREFILVPETAIQLVKYVNV